MTDVYRLPRVRIDAEVHLSGRQVRKVSLFLGDRAETRPGPERPSDLLNSSADFIPALERDAVVLINLENVLRVTVDAEHEIGIDDISMLDVSLAQATRQRVHVMLEDGTTTRGDLSYVLPEGQRRIQDYLNAKERFFPLYDGGLVHLIRKSRVVLVTPH